MKLGSEQQKNYLKNYYADGEGGLIIETSEDVTPWVEANKAEYNATDERAKWGDLTRIASVPDSIILEWNRLGFCRGYYITDQKALKAWLNDPANRAWRTRPGQI